MFEASKEQKRRGPIESKVGHPTAVLQLKEVPKHTHTQGVERYVVKLDSDRTIKCGKIDAIYYCCVARFGSDRISERAIEKGRWNELSGTCSLVCTVCTAY